MERQIKMKTNGRIKRYNKILGLPVISVSEAKTMGFVKSIVLNNKEKRVKGIIIENAKIKKKRYFVLIEDVENIGEDAVTIRNREKRIQVKNKIIGNGRMKELKIFSESGLELGTMKDILFDLKTGNIQCIELSEDIYQDLKDGRKIMPLKDKYEFGEEMMVVDNDAIEQSVSTGGGIRNKFFKNL